LNITPIISEDKESVGRVTAPSVLSKNKKIKANDGWSDIDESS
jgi:hypothetical protein